MSATATPQRDPDGLAPETAAAQVRAWRRDVAALLARLRAPLPEPVQRGEDEAWIESLQFRPHCKRANRHNVADLLYLHVRASGKRMWCMRLRRKVDGQMHIVTETLGEWPRMKFREALSVRDEVVAAFAAGREWMQCEL